MPRHARKKSSIRTYHIIIKGADRQLLFEEQKDYLKYLDILRYYKEKFHFQIYAYCLMSNHVHLLIQHSAEFTLESIFRPINTTYAGWFNHKYQRTGFLQDGRYHSEPVENISYLLTVIRYIHYNPAKAGLEKVPGSSYPWSSFYEYQNGITDLTDTEDILALFDSPNQFFESHIDVHSDDCIDIHKIKIRLPDDVAQSIIEENCNCNTVTDFQKLSLSDRNKYLVLLHQKGLSIRQLNRLTGTPRGIIQRTVINT